MSDQDESLSLLGHSRVSHLNDLIGSVISITLEEVLDDVNDETGELGTGVCPVSSHESFDILKDDPGRLDNVCHADNLIDQFISGICRVLLAGMTESLARTSCYQDIDGTFIGFKDLIGDILDIWTFRRGVH